MGNISGILRNVTEGGDCGVFGGTVSVFKCRE
jgi:hypothetical protein